MNLQKKELRKNVQNKISEYSAFELAQKGQKISTQLSWLIDHLLSLLPQTDEKFFPILGVYAPLSDEVDWGQKMQKWENQFSFPDLLLNHGGEEVMEFYAAKCADLVETKHYGVAFKAPGKKDKLKKVKPDILIIPGRAFSSKGERLGRGKGFYDKYLKDFTGICIGICLSDFLFDHLPTEGHDQKVDYIITEKEIIDASDRGTFFKKN